MGGVEPIAIVGIGCRLPGGVKSPDDLWKLLRDGVDAITEVPNERWYPSVYHPDPVRPGRMNSRWGGFLDHVDRFDAEFFGISPREAALADPQQRIMLEVAYEAVEDAGLTLPALENKRASVYVGISTFDYGAMQFDSQDRSAIDSIHQPRRRAEHCRQPHLIFLQPCRPQPRRRHRLFVLVGRH